MFSLEMWGGRVIYDGWVPRAPGLKGIPPVKRASYFPSILVQMAHAGHYFSIRCHGPPRYLVPRSRMKLNIWQQPHVFIKLFAFHAVNVRVTTCAPISSPHRFPRLDLQWVNIPAAGTVRREFKRPYEQHTASIQTRLKPTMTLVRDCSLNFMVKMLKSVWLSEWLLSLFRLFAVIALLALVKCGLWEGIYVPANETYPLTNRGLRRGSQVSSFKVLEVFSESYIYQVVGFCLQLFSFILNAQQTVIQWPWSSFSLRL